MYLRMRKDEELEQIKKDQARILELLEKGAKVDPKLLGLRKEDVACDTVSDFKYST